MDMNYFTADEMATELAKWKSVLDVRETEETFLAEIMFDMGVAFVIRKMRESLGDA